MPTLLPIQPVIQKYSHDCGPAVARSVLAHFGVPAAGIDRVLRANRSYGTPPQRLSWLFTATGLAVESRHRMAVADLRRAAESGRVVVCPVQHRTEGHWVAIRGASDRRIFLMCPLRGLVAVPTPAFRAAWVDATACGVRLERFGIIVGR